jgi:hypothetical protein
MAPSFLDRSQHAMQDQSSSLSIIGCAADEIMMSFATESGKDRIELTAFGALLIGGAAEQSPHVVRA